MPPTTHQSSPERGQSFVGPVDAQATIVAKPHERAHGLRLVAHGLKLVVKWSILIGMGTAMAIAGGTVGEVIGGAVLAFALGRTIRRMAGPRWHEYRSRHHNGQDGPPSASFLEHTSDGNSHDLV